MKLARWIILLIFIFGFISSYSQNWDQIIKTCASDRQAEDNFGCSVSIDGDYAIVGAKYEDHDLVGGSNKLQAGSAYIFKNESGTWTQVQKIVASDRSADDWFGNSVAISGDYIVVGAYLEDEDESGANTFESAGSAYIFKNESGTWTEVQKIVASDRSAADYFGYAVDISGDYIVVGAYMEDENEVGAATMANAGSAYIFYNNAGTWEQTQKIVALDRYNNDYFGYAVAVNNDHLIVGAYNEDENVAGGEPLNSAGSAYIYKNNAGTWTQLQKIVASDRNELDNFGWSVDIYGDYAIVGAYSEDEDGSGSNTMEESGSAYIFKNNTGTWSEIDKIVASDREAGDRFGYAVAINGDYAVVGAYLEDEDESGLNSYENSGSAYVFKNDAGTWSEEQKIVSADRRPADWFGISVAVSNVYVYIGAQLQDYDINGENNYPSSGAAYIFQNCREINVKQNTTDIANGGEFSFGVIPFGDNSGEVVFTIENTGVDNLLLTGDPKIEISGPDAADFSINQSAVSSPILPETSTTFSITFTPSSVNLHTAEISISNNDNDENPYVFTINGSGGNLTQTISGFEAIPDKTYGDEAFVVSATASSGLDVVFTSSDENVATCIGTNGSTILIVNAGTCQIYANQPGNAIYLAAPEVAQTLNVNVKPIDVTVDIGQSKYYGDVDPAFTFSVDPALVVGDFFSGALSRLGGEDIGYYEIQQGTLTAGSNYNITFFSDDFEIEAKPVTVTVDAGQSKVYGDSDPAYTYSVSPALVGGDNFTGVLIRAAGEDVGFYEIQQGSLSLSANYVLSFVSDDFEISPKVITVTANANQTKIYGVGDPVFAYGYTPSLVLGDSFTGVLSRESGEDVGQYQILQGTLDLGTNYSILFVSNDFEILQKPITVVAYSNQFKTYGQNDPTFIYYSIPSPLSGDEFSGALSRVAGEDVGYYAIELGTLSLGPNYDISLTSADFQIKVKSIAILVDEGQSKEYGDDDPAEFTYTTNTPIAAWDSFTGALTREPGEAVGTYAILQGTLALNSNYNVSFVSEDFSITVKQITVTADSDQTKVYGDDDPAEYTYTVTGTLASGDEFTGALTRDFGENIGIYQIKIG
ncbi:MAG: MBG domain-containing protein, partial [Bacteroidales bacterium]|nr:MBG domain-containing protein [Bacteroidales bacterium]